MCGICGVIYKDGRRADPALLKSANDLLIHRGPDDEGTYTEGPLGLAMRRLAIIDLNTGHQPISYDNGNLWIVFNGEIYNFQELRAELEKRGHVFQTKTDTEAILALYQEQGADAVRSLRGMFAFAIWDRRRRRLMLARDRIGEKPLVYTDQPGFLAFASELRALRVFGAPRELDPQALDEYLSLQCVPSPRTIYSGVNKLPPAHILLHDGGRTEIRRYWDLPTGRPPVTADPIEAQALVRDKVREAVRLRMVADVPLGAFLSGGIDSSIVVATMSEFSPRPVKTFSIGFLDAEFSELPYARELARRYGCEHAEFIIRPEMTDLLPKLAWHYGEPYADSSALPSYCVARETRRAVTVALNGDGGDENFAGYIRYFAMKAARFYDAMPAPARRAGLGLASWLVRGGSPGGWRYRGRRFLGLVREDDPLRRYLRLVDNFPWHEKEGLYTAEFRSRLGSGESARRYLAAAFESAAGHDPINALLYTDFKTLLPECLLVKMDIATMANSLEGRSPLLDHELVELVFRMPGEWKLKGLRGHKWILKEAFREKLPPAIFDRGKMGFGIPQARWLRGPLRAFWEERVLSPEALRRGYFEERALRRLWEEHQAGRRDHSVRLWALMMLELWHTCR